MLPTGTHLALPLRDEGEWRHDAEGASYSCHLVLIKGQGYPIRSGRNGGGGGGGGG